ncbi:oxidoreductase FAD-binding subunit [Pseudomonas sp. ATCC 13867]|uniref:PepSY domain-containing protein n=1 Tax=Pseudomonas sp. ATCC 13867 TaxID=1294143 RepID=UPI0002C4F163|nr:PepSY domain-containing protein [Pseudomonas sp. ATCC 13867]AGI24168.1 oxidoreductase FAD-binding subunit [Pseudomonas sp. ATCC 13867]
MLRRLHAWPGILLAALLLLLAGSGALLATQPLAERLAAGGEPSRSVAQIAAQVSQQVPGIERLERHASGLLIAYDEQGALRISARDGSVLDAYEPSPLYRVAHDLHRALLLGEPGHALAGAGALGMLLLGVSGLILLARRQGGWRKLAGPVRGDAASRWHNQVGRALLPVALLFGLSGIYLSAVHFELIPDGSDQEPAFPTHLAQGTPQAPGELKALLDVPLRQLRELEFPVAGASQSAYTLRTAKGDGYVDPVSGELLGYLPHAPARRLNEFIYDLHSGELFGAASPVLGLAALGVPLLGITGLLLLLRRRRAPVRDAGQASADSAECVLLVGSETNGTWAFAQALQAALAAAGRRVHSAPLKQGARAFPAARELLVLTATYGDGDAPQSAVGFLDHLGHLRLPADARFAVLGFGDRRFPRFCQYAAEVDAALAGRGLQRLLPRRDMEAAQPQDFSTWTGELGNALGLPLRIGEVGMARPESRFRLIERHLHDAPGDTPLVVLRFAALGSIAAYQAGDLLAVHTPGAAAPRRYSLASDSSDGLLDICVRLRPGGLCSGYLHGLRPGDEIAATLQPHREFRPQPGETPLILIGAGSGIGPLVGFVRQNRCERPLYLYWGGRVPEAGVPFAPDLDRARADGRLRELRMAFSAGPQRAYVQDHLRRDAAELRQLLAAGAQVLVCGGRGMAEGVRKAIDELLGPLALSVEHLRAGGRYREDLF